MSFAVERCQDCDQILDDDTASTAMPGLCDVCADAYLKER